MTFQGWYVVKQKQEICRSWWNTPEVWKISKFDNILLWYCNQNIINRWTKGCILPFSKKGDLIVAKNYQGITLTFIVAKFYNSPLFNHIEPEVKIILKNQNGFQKNRFTPSQILTIHWILGVRAKKSWGNTIIHWLLHVIWLYTQRKDGANTSDSRYTQRNHHRHNDAI